MSQLDKQGGSELVPFCRASGKRFFCNDLSRDPEVQKIMKDVVVDVGGLDELCRICEVKDLRVSISQDANVCYASSSLDLPIEELGDEVGEIAENLELAIQNLLNSRMEGGAKRDILFLALWFLASFAFNAVSDQPRNPESVFIKNSMFLAICSVLLFHLEKKRNKVFRILPGAFLRYAWVYLRVGKVVDVIEEPEE